MDLFQCFRCIALSSIGVYLYEELCHQTLHSKLHEAVIVLLGNLRVGSSTIAEVHVVLYFKIHLVTLNDSILFFTD